MKTKLLTALFIFVAFASCRKDDDYRDRFVGKYECQITGRAEARWASDVVIDSSKIKYWIYKEGYNPMASDTSSSFYTYNEELRTIIDTIYVKTSGDSAIQIESASYRIGVEYGIPTVLSLNNKQEYGIIISDDGKFIGGTTYNSDCDSIKGTFINDSLIFNWKYGYGGVITIFFEDLYYKGKKIK